MKFIFNRLILYFIAIIIAGISFIPFVVLLQIGLNSPSHLAINGILSLPNFTINNILYAWNSSNLGKAMLNSSFITISALVLTVLASALASYAIARFPNKLNRWTYNVFIYSMAIPAIISTVPLYIQMRTLGLVNTRWGIILLDTTGSLPFAIFLFTSFIKAISQEMEEAAIIDGCSWFSAFWRVLFPNLKPITSTVILINSITFWNEYGRSVFFLQSKEKHTVPLAISTFFQKYGAKWELIAGAAIIAMIPTVAVFLIFQKSYVKGLTEGAVKG